MKTEKGDGLHKMYFKSPSNPTILIVNSEGKEIDMIRKYDKNPGKYKERIEKILRGEDTIRSFRERLESNPDDLLALYELAQRYYKMFEREKTNEMYIEITKKPDIAKQIEITLPNTIGKVNLY
ncbi:hypothetical protein ACFL4T_10575, partial [candidate division KSB1 bacterium]